MLSDLTAASAMSNHHSTCIITCAFIQMLYQGKHCSKHVLHCSNCNPSQSCCHIIVLFPYRKLHATFGPPLYERSTGKTKCRMAFTAQTYQRTGFSRWAHANLIQTQCYARATQSRFVFSLVLLALRMFVRLQKYFWIPQMLMKPRTKWHPGLMTVRSGPRQTYSPACLTGREAGR